MSLENVSRSLLHNTEKEFLPSFDRKIKKSFRVYLTQAEGPVLGVGSKMFSVAGPVLVCGIASAMAVGVIYWLIEKI